MGGFRALGTSDWKHSLILLTCTSHANGPIDRRAFGVFNLSRKLIRRYRCVLLFLPQHVCNFNLSFCLLQLMKEILDRDRKKQAEREAEKKALAEGAKSNKEEEKTTAGVTSEKPKANA